MRPEQRSVRWAVAEGLVGEGVGGRALRAWWALPRCLPPSLAWAILAAIWFDPGDFGVIFVEVAILIPFCLINVAEGLRNIDRELIEMGRSFTRQRTRMLWHVTLPLLVPYGLSAIRIAYGIAWKIALVAELLGAPSGIGYLMLRAQIAADSTTFLATCFAVVLMFVAGERLVIVPLERRFARR